MGVVDLKIHRIGETTADDAAGPGHDFIQYGGDQAPVDGIGEAGLVRLRDPLGLNRVTVVVKTKIQTLGIMIATGKTGAGLGELGHRSNLRSIGSEANPETYRAGFYFPPLTQRINSDWLPAHGATKQLG